jgi:hypothetical protein
MKRLFAAPALLAALSLGLPVWAQDSQDSLPIKDATGATQAQCAYTVTGLIVECHIDEGVDSSGVHHQIITDSSGHILLGVVPLPTNAAQETGGNLAGIASSTAAGAASAATAATNTGSTAASAATIATQTAGLAKESGGNLAASAASAATTATNTGRIPSPNGDGGMPAHVTNFPADVIGTGTIAAATLNAAYTVTLNGDASAGFGISGLTASGATLTAQASADGTNWTSVNENALNGVMQATLTTDGQYRFNTGGRTKFRLLVSSVGTGTITVGSVASAVSGKVGLSDSLPPGSNPIGTVGPYILTPLGFQTVASFSASTGFTPPTGATVCFIQAEGNPVRWRDDGTAPTASAGQLLPLNTLLTYSAALSAVRFIPTTGSSTLDVGCYR